jgi:hypothetical protein
LLLGVVDDGPAAGSEAAAEKPARRGRGRTRGDANATDAEAGATEEKPARTRTPRAKKSSNPA